MKKKADFKKLALLGIAGGTMFANQATASEVLDRNNFDNQLSFAGCGGNATGGGGCNGKAPISGYQGNAANGGYYQAPQQYQGQQPQNMQMQPGQQPNMHMQPGQQPNMQMQPGQQPNMQMHPAQPQMQGAMGCGGQQPAQGYYTNYNAQPSAGCSTMSHPQQSWATNQPSAGCGGMNQQQWAGNQPAANTNGYRAPREQAYNGRPATSPAQTADGMSQWETSANQSPSTKGNWNSYTSEAEVMAPKQVSPAEFREGLSADLRKKWDSADPAVKAMALQLANQPAFKDKNTAFKVAEQRAAEKRAKAPGNN